MSRRLIGAALKEKKAWTDRVAPTREKKGKAWIGRVASMREKMGEARTDRVASAKQEAVKGQEAWSEVSNGEIVWRDEVASKAAQERKAWRGTRHGVLCLPLRFPAQGVGCDGLPLRVAVVETQVERENAETEEEGAADAAGGHGERLDRAAAPVDTHVDSHVRYSRTMQPVQRWVGRPLKQQQ